MSREIEVKLRFAGPAEAREKLTGLGAVETVPRLFEDNVLFDRAYDPLSVARKALRLRRVGDRAVITYKGPVEGSHKHKVRVEHETRVADGDAAERIFLALGFTPRWRYQKFRTEWSLEGLHVSLDETPLGCFVELEGDPVAIDRVAERMGISAEDYETRSYRELAEFEAGREGNQPADLVFGPEDLP